MKLLAADADAHEPPIRDRHSGGNFDGTKFSFFVSSEKFPRHIGFLIIFFYFFCHYRSDFAQKSMTWNFQRFSEYRVQITII